MALQSNFESCEAPSLSSRALKHHLEKICFMRKVVLDLYQVHRFALIARAPSQQLCKAVPARISWALLVSTQQDLAQIWQRTPACALPAALLHQTCVTRCNACEACECSGVDAGRD